MKVSVPGIVILLLLASVGFAKKNESSGQKPKPPQTSVHKPTLIDGTAAVVGKTLITVEDARFYRALHRYKEGLADALNVELVDELKRTVQKMIFEELVFEEMKNLRIEGGGKAEVEKALGAAKEKGRKEKWREILARFGKTEAEGVNRLVKSWQVEKFIQKKVETLTPIITEAEIEKYYRQNQSRFKGEDYLSLKQGIVLLLKRQRVEKGLEEWIRFLKEKYAVRNLLEG
ncbi:MAG: hypothetical protein HY537_04050 [Deltaproteobacteria bacterium]|nr:hypothetical protein [Deltaproteobacteria bacterium]